MKDTKFKINCTWFTLVDIYIYLWKHEYKNLSLSDDYIFCRNVYILYHREKITILNWGFGTNKLGISFNTIDTW